MFPISSCLVKTQQCDSHFRRIISFIKGFKKLKNKNFANSNILKILVYMFEQIMYHLKL